ncbi:aminoglycoside phosphotransferase family protein [Kocuria sabuli]|uniref:aminoglycoside phosphotransferase family protein n=1 Tax=Kocuria sabuli TaxID=3071448 RepID=UPI0034D5D49F
MSDAAAAAQLPAGPAARYLAAWELVPDGRARDDDGALALPVRTRAGDPALLRISAPGARSEHEHLALRLWGGRGAVRLLRAEPADRALLLERTGERDLHALPVLEACRVLGELTRALARPPRPPFPRLSAAARQWREDLAGATELDARFPRRFRLQAVKNLERLLRGELDTALVHQDLHHGAVRAAQRSPWLAAGADPVLGTPEFALVPALWRRTEQAGHGGALAAALEDRIEALSLAAGSDPERLRAWALVRFAVAARAGAARPTGAPHRELSRLVQLCKAVQRGA